MKVSTVLRFLVILIAAVFIIHQAISAFYNPVKTENAVFYTAVDDFKITGLIIRNETLVESDATGVMHYVISDGSRVSKDGVIANIYDNESASITVTNIDSVNAKIADIEDILSYNDVEAANLDLINARIGDRVNEFILATSSGDYSAAASEADDLLSAITRKQAAIGVANDLSARLDTLKAELTKLSASLPTVKGSIYAAQSGYFVSKTDGYEQVFTCEDLSKITPEFLKDASAKETGANVIGKIVSDYEWYIAAEVSIDESVNYKEGESLIINTSVKTSPQLPVTVKKINISDSSSKAVILFACNQMNSELASMRSGPMSVVKAEYSGLKVARKALRVVDNVRGVYVLSGMQIEFIPVNIVYSTDSYIICEKQSENGEFLKLYDRVVVKGKNLYDGKIIS